MTLFETLKSHFKDLFSYNAIHIDITYDHIFYLKYPTLHQKIILKLLYEIALGVRAEIVSVTTFCYLLKPAGTTGLCKT